MFTQRTRNAVHVLFGATATAAVLAATPAQAADPIEHPPSTMNQASVYESTLKFYLHPARLELGTEPPRERMDHPAVIVARRAPASYDWTSAFILHPARLAFSSEAPRPESDHPTAAAAKAGGVWSNPTAKVGKPHATMTKASKLSVVHTTQVSPPNAGK